MTGTAWRPMSSIIRCSWAAQPSASGVAPSADSRRTGISGPARGLVTRGSGRSGGRLGVGRAFVHIGNLVAALVAPQSSPQCRKWRLPVRTRLHRRLGRGDDLGVAREPPGWTNAVTPAAAHTSTASGNGKNASEAQTAPPIARRPCPGQPGAVDAAHLTGANAHHGAALTSTMAFDRTWRRPARQGRDRASHPATGPGGRRGPGRGGSIGTSASVTSTAPPALRSSTPATGGLPTMPGSSSSRRSAGRPARRRRRVERRRDDDLEEDGGQPLGEREVDRRRSPPRRHRRRSPGRPIGRPPRQPWRPGLRRATRIAMLDDDAATPPEVARHARRGGRIEQVVVAQRLALDATHPRERPASRVGARQQVQRCRLVGVLAVAQLAATFQ